MRERCDPLLQSSACDRCGNSPGILDQRSTWYLDRHLPGGQLLLWWFNPATMLGLLLSSIVVVAGIH
jgi:hypothetical protein